MNHKSDTDFIFTQTDPNYKLSGQNQALIVICHVPQIQS